MSLNSRLHSTQAVVTRIVAVPVRPWTIGSQAVKNSRELLARPSARSYSWLSFAPTEQGCASTSGHAPCALEVMGNESVVAERAAVTSSSKMSGGVGKAGRVGRMNSMREEVQPTTKGKSR